MVDDNNPFRGADLEGDPEYLKHLYTTRKPFKQVIQEGEKVFGVPPGFPTTVDVYEKREPPMDIDEFARKVDELALIFERQKLTDLGAAKLAEALGESNLTYEDVQAKLTKFLDDMDPSAMQVGMAVSVVKEEPGDGYSWKLQVSVQPGTPAYDLLARVENTRKLAAQLNVTAEWIQDLNLSDKLLATLVKGKDVVAVNLGEYGHAIREQTERWLAGDHPVGKLKITLEDLLSTTQKNSPAITPPLTPQEKENLRAVNLKDYFANWPMKCIYYVRTPKDSEVIPTGLPGEPGFGGFKRGELQTISSRMRPRSPAEQLFQIQESVRDPNEFLHVKQLKVRTRNGELKPFDILKFDSALKWAFDDEPSQPPLGERMKARRHKTTLRDRERLIEMGRTLGISEEFLTPQALSTTQESLSSVMFVSARQTGKSRAMAERMAAAIFKVTMPRKYWAMTTKRGWDKAALELGKFRKQR